MKRHKVKQERPEGCRSYKSKKQNDLAYCIHDRVELLHQVFSLLKPKEIKAMAPDCVRDISLEDLQELCLEELLGISSKRLLAALDGAPPPSDTESSSDDSDRRRGANNLDTISLDSISSDEGVLSTGHGNENSKKHKHCKRRDKRKRTEKSKAEAPAGAGAGGERERAAERAGLTVLELLELQARARAIRAQLNAEIERKNAAAAAAAPTGIPSVSDDDVEIKEEPPEVVELVSSDDEAKPDLKQLQASVVDGPAEPKQPETPLSEARFAEDDTRVVTKRADLTIIVPKTPTARKIKLNRQKTVTVAATINTVTTASIAPTSTNDTDKGASSSTTKTLTAQNNADEQDNRNAETRRVTIIQVNGPPKKKDKAKKSKKAKRAKNAEGSDQDEIMLQLSDSEKMDLLENLDRKRYDQDTSSSSEEDSEDERAQKSSKHEPVTVKSDIKPTIVNETDIHNNGDDSTVTRNVESHRDIQDHVDNNSATSDCMTNGTKDHLKGEDVLRVENVAVLNTGGDENGGEGKAIDEDRDSIKKTVESVEDNSAVTEKNSAMNLDSQSVENCSIDTQCPNEVTESNFSSAVQKQDNGKSVSENLPPVLEENEIIETEATINNSTATKDDISITQELSLEDLVKDPASMTDVALKELDNSDVEIIKKTKKKKSKKEKKSKKDKKNKE